MSYPVFVVRKAKQVGKCPCSGFVRRKLWHCQLIVMHLHSHAGDVYRYLSHCVLDSYGSISQSVLVLRNFYLGHSVQTDVFISSLDNLLYARNWSCVTIRFLLQDSGHTNGVLQIKSWGRKARQITRSFSTITFTLKLLRFRRSSLFLLFARHVWIEMPCKGKDGQTRTCLTMREQLIVITGRCFP